MSKNKRGSGRNKTRKKQREYKDHCRTMTLAGYYTDHSGQWREATPQERKSTMFRALWGGYKQKTE